MLAVVKKRRTNKRLFEIKGDIPENIVDYFKAQYGTDFEILSEADELIDIFETEWFKKTSKTVTPGENIKIYRQNLGLTQAQLGKRLGNFSKQNISDMENGRRGISKEIAKKLSLIFEMSIERFL
ncbi:MAG: helix-turn-helix transcriptional regulator [Calditrichaceae bacterium]|nr:helix-turn-helix transcriptional regulator [Calditrichaceae bacterium]MBN2710801.1 helix-turn-helix transcriptional regulator [Calditrichaceae bacterium]RQV94720.1 MAG: XRE family transcriptional regulator [Calditrichota bacterium]